VQLLERMKAALGTTQPKAGVYRRLMSSARLLHARYWYGLPWVRLVAGLFLYVHIRRTASFQSISAGRSEGIRYSWHYANAAKLQLNPLFNAIVVSCWAKPGNLPAVDSVMSITGSLYYMSWYMQPLQLGVRPTAELWTQWLSSTSPDLAHETANIPTLSGGKTRQKKTWWWMVIGCHASKTGKIAFQSFIA